MTLLFAMFLLTILLELLPRSHAFNMFQASRFKNVERIASKCGNVASKAKDEVASPSREALPRLRVILDLDRTMVYLNEFEEIYWKSRPVQLCLYELLSDNPQYCYFLHFVRWM